MSNCKHQPVQIGPEYCYTGPVAVPPYTDDNPMAGGSISYTEECRLCGAQREVNQNGLHMEYGTYGCSRAQREQIERERVAYERFMRISAAQKKLQKERIRVSILRTGDVAIDMPHGRSVLAMARIAEAARQEDTGDGLVQFYDTLLTVAADLSAKHCAYDARHA